jgi:hypothetical protein
VKYVSNKSCTEESNKQFIAGLVFSHKPHNLAVSVRRDCSIAAAAAAATTTTNSNVAAFQFFQVKYQTKVFISFRLC